MVSGRVVATGRKSSGPPPATRYLKKYSFLGRGEGDRGEMKMRDEDKPFVS
jgi:hypothetical protein